MSVWLWGAVILLCGSIVIAVLAAAIASRRPLRGICGSGMRGLCALGLVNLLGGITQVSLGFSWLSVGASFLLGIPGVVLLLLLNILLSAV